MDKALVLTMISPASVLMMMIAAAQTSLLLLRWFSVPPQETPTMSPSLVTDLVKGFMV
jgi:hypothetical protein